MKNFHTGLRAGIFQIPAPPTKKKKKQDPNKEKDRLKLEEGGWRSSE